jgi:hypothetical protein
MATSRLARKITGRWSAVGGRWWQNEAIQSPNPNLPILNLEMLMYSIAIRVPVLLPMMLSPCRDIWNKNPFLFWSVGRQDKKEG